MMRLYKYQRDGVEELLRHGGGILADEMGLGKTAQAVEFCNRVHAESVLVICPASLLFVWEREFKKWGNGELKKRSIGVVKNTKQFPDADIVVMNYAKAKALHRFTTAREWAVLICDEAHYLKNLRADRTKHILGNRMIKGIPARRKLFLTGTPYKNEAADVFPLANAIRPGSLGKLKDFRARYGRYTLIPLRTRYGTKYIEKPIGIDNERELLERLKAIGFVRRLKDEVLDELPEKTIQIIPLPGVKASSIREIQKATNDDGVPIATLRRLIALAKVNSAVEHIRELLESGERPIVVFAHHREVIEDISEQLTAKGYKTAEIYGGTKDRADIVDRFQRGELDVLVASITAAGVGITLTRARVSVFAELDWVPANVFQAEDRVHRIGQKDSVLIQYLIVPNSIDEMVALALFRKEADILKFIGLSDRNYFGKRSEE